MDNMPVREGYWWVDGDPFQPAFGTLAFYQALMDDLVYVHWEDAVGRPPGFEPGRWDELDELMEGLCSDIPRFLLGTQLGNSEVRQILWDVDQCQREGCALTYEECVRESELMTLDLEY